MKKNLSLCLLGALVSLSAVSVPVFADEIRHEEQHADREAARAADSRADASMQRRQGHHVRAALRARHARHEEHRAMRHEGDAVRRADGR
jgi:hypothetical protein